MSAAQKTNDPSTAADSTKARSALWSIPATLGALSNTVCIGVAIRSSQLGVSTFAASDSLSPSPPLGVDFTSSREEFFVFLQQTTATINAASAANAMPTKTHVCSRDRVVSGECAVGTGWADDVGAFGVVAVMVGASVTLLGSAVDEILGVPLGMCDGARLGARDGARLGSCEGTRMGALVGPEGDELGARVGARLGMCVGARVGDGIGRELGKLDGAGLGGAVGTGLGTGVGEKVATSTESAVALLIESRRARRPCGASRRRLAAV